MGLLDQIKLKYACKKEGRMAEYEEYTQFLEQKKADINRYKKYINDSILEFEDVKLNFPEDSEEYREAKDKINRWREALNEAELTIKFIRPNFKEDIDYRNKQCNDFTKELQAVISQNLDLRFHGTPIYFAEQIIKTGTISSTADRYDGYIKSTDAKGEISASNAKTLGRTIGFFSDMVAYQRGLPAGCIFAVFPKDENDATFGIDILQSIDFRQNPEQLFGIFTTHENINQVRGWMEQSEFDRDLVYTFEEFLQVVREKSKEIESQGFYQDIARMQDVIEKDILQADENKIESIVQKEKKEQSPNNSLHTEIIDAITKHEVTMIDYTNSINLFETIIEI